jgi:hypothetical protein
MCVSKYLCVLLFILFLQVDHRRAYNCEIMLSKVKVPPHELMVS